MGVIRGCQGIKCNLSDYILLSEDEYETVNCKNTFEGVYNFTYEMQEGGGGICAHPNSIIVACQEPGKFTSAAAEIKK